MSSAQYRIFLFARRLAIVIDFFQHFGFASASGIQRIQRGLSGRLVFGFDGCGEGAAVVERGFVGGDEFLLEGLEGRFNPDRTHRLRILLQAGDELIELGRHLVSGLALSGGLSGGFDVGLDFAEVVTNAIDDRDELVTFGNFAIAGAQQREGQ